jgi:hypothetical protein
MNNFAHDIAVISRSLDLKDRRIAELEAILAARVTAAATPYPNAALTSICEQLLQDWDLTLEQIANLAADIPGECEAIEDNRNEVAWMNQQESLMESGGPDDSQFRRDMINAGRGHLLGDKS